MKEVHEIFDFVGLENVAEGGHGSAAIVNLMLDFFFVQAFTDGTQIRPKISPAAVCPMAVLTSFLVKECGSGLFGVA
jgi:hypothetical protein